MKIILIKNVPNLGQKDEIKEVAGGYARNFLFPKKMAVAATPADLRDWVARKKILELKAEADLKEVGEVAKKLDGLELEINAKTEPGGQLYGSINEVKIVKALKDKGFKIPKSQIILGQPIKEVGDHEISINLAHGLEVKIKVIVAEE